MTTEPGGICIGTCNSQWRKAHALYADGLAKYDKALEQLADGDDVPNPPAPPDIRPWYGQPYWCGRCMALIKAELAELDDLASMLAALPPGIRPAVSAKHERVKVSGSHGTPSASPSGDSLEELAAWLKSWEAMAKDEDDPTPRRGHLATEITTVRSWLYAHFDLLMLNPDVAQPFGEETRAWHRELIARAHAASAAKHVKQPCPRCKLFTLWEELGQDYLKCINVDCNRRLTRAELDAETAA